MKKSILFVFISVLVFSGSVLQAQIGIGAGYLNSTFKTKSGGSIIKSDPFHGFYAGLDYNLDIAYGLSVTFGLDYSFLSSKDESSLRIPLVDLTLKNRQQEHYLNIPVNIAYTFTIVDNFKIFAYGGPRFVVGLASRNKSDATGDFLGIRIDGDFVYDFYKDEIKSDNLSDQFLESINQNFLGNTGKHSRFDLQLGVGIGFELFNLLTIKGGYDWGLLNRYRGNYADNNSLKRNQFYVGLGIVF